MFTVLIDQIEHHNNSVIQNYCVGQVYVTNEIIQFSERKLIDKNSVNGLLAQFLQSISCLGNMML